MKKYIKKILIIGNHGVGKTSLATRYVENKFSDTYLTTIGVNILKKNVMLNDRGEVAAVALMLWDIEGTNQRQTIPVHYAKGCNGFVVVLDATRPDTLESLDIHLQFISDFDATLPFIIAVNKSDLDVVVSLDAVKIQQEYPNCVDVIYTSAKADENVETLFTKITKSTIW